MAELTEAVRQNHANAHDANALALAASSVARDGAGAEGRGFVVVANDVCSLAQHSAAAANDIKALIGESIGAIESGAGIAGAASVTMREILDRAHEVADLLAAIDAASAEQAAGITQVRGVIDEMDGATRRNAAMVDRAASAADTMRVQAERLTGVVATFKVRAPARAPVDAPVEEAGRAPAGRALLPT